MKQESILDAPRYHIDEAAKKVGVHVSTLFRAVKEGNLDSFRLGRKRYIFKTDLESWLAQKIQRGAPKKPRNISSRRPPLVKTGSPLR